MDLLSLLKQANIFSPTGQIAPQQFPVGSVGGPIDNSPMQQSQAPDLMSAIQGLLQPNNQQFNNYQQMISSMPQRQDYQPDLLRRIGATLAGMGTGSPVGISGGAVLGYKSDIPTGLKVQRAINEEPYDKALTDWATKLEPTGKAAQMEQTRNVSDRQTALGTLQRQQAQEKLDEQERAALEKERQGREKIDISRERAEAYVNAKKFAQDHPEYEKFVDEDGNLVLYNPTDPTAEPIYPGVKQLSPMEKIDLQVKGELKKIAARTEATRDIEGVRQANRVENEATRQINRKDLKLTPAPIRPSSSTTSPAGIKTAGITAAQNLKIKNPEWSKYIKIDKGLVSVMTPEEKNGPSQSVYDSITNALGITKGTEKLTSDIQLPSSSAQPSSAAPTRELARPEDARMKAARSKVEAGYVLITDGKSFGQVKPEDIDKLPKGWAVVK